MNLNDWSLKEKRDTASLMTWSVTVEQNTADDITQNVALPLVTVEATSDGKQ